MLNQILELARPLQVLDLETTGLDCKTDRVIQISITIHYPREENKDTKRWSTLIDPETPILNNQHGITDEMVAGKPKFRELAARLASNICGVDIGGYNVNFDIDFLRCEFKRAEVDWPWAGYILDPYIIYRQYKGHTLVNCYKEFGGEDGNPLPEDTDVEDAHDAEFDVKMTEASLRGQLLRFKHLPRTVAELSEFCFPRNKNAIDKSGKFVWIGDNCAINFGKHRGKLLVNVDRGYLKWITISDFPEEVVTICQNALDGIFPVKE